MSNRNIKSGREIPRVLRLLAYPILFFLCERIRSETFSSLAGCHALNFCALSLLVVFYGLAWEIEYHLTEHRRLLPQVFHRPELRTFAAALIQCFAFATVRFETEHDLVVLPAGAAILAVALFTFHRRSIMLAECLALAGATVLCDNLWLAALPILFYTALMLDCRLSAAAPYQDAETPAFALPAPQGGVYYMIFTSGIFLGTLKEIIF